MIQGEKVRLRAMNETDIETVCTWENDSSLWESSAAMAPYTAEEIASLLTTADPDDFAENGQLRFIIELTDGGEAIGTIDLTDYTAAGRRAAVGILIYKECFRRQGYASQALKLVIDHASGELGLHQLYAYMPSDNRGSIALFTSAGFAECGLLRDWVRADGGRWKDAVMTQLIFSN